ncbi:hypothetical protein FACS189421_00940 [Bacteroidia bacterium]|nr:hypothetical protein FACS189421_00940 [Bacteroidia bacterium]GHT46203.1 hypothetical protein FACS189440_03730 [Bacteroidia bacterium]
MKKTFEENDAGFQYVIDRKGIQAYDIHNQLFDQKVTSTKNNDECAGILNEWLQFFRKGHIGIAVLKNDLLENTQKTIQTFPDWEKMEVDTTAFKKFLDTKKDFDLEGIWQDGVYTIGIKKIDDQFVGFIIDSQAEEWEKGQVKFRIYPDSVLFYMRNHSLNKLKQAYLASRNLVFFDDFSNFWRIYPKYDDKYLNALINLEPYVEPIDDNTLYLQIPSFNTGYKTAIDSVLNTNKDKILSTKNLIIDIRNNGGGDDGSFSELVSYLYTNPIRTVGVEYRSTKQNNEAMLDIANDTIYGTTELLKNWARGSYKVLEKNLGKFVRLSPALSIDQRDTVYNYPQNVGIIIDNFCGSTTEQFLLAAKQSKKVKLFGKKTAGALDVSNLHRVDSPCKEFRLYYTRSKSYRIPDMAIDDAGIQPDFYLDDTIPEYQWVDYVRSILDYDIQ